MDSNQFNKLMKDNSKLKQAKEDLSLKVQRLENQISKFQEKEKEVNELKTMFENQKRMQDNEAA